MQPNPEAPVQAPGFIQNLIPGSENAIQGFNENLKTQPIPAQSRNEENKPGPNGMLPQKD